jgi:dynein heavy chain, axonemal
VPSKGLWKDRDGLCYWRKLNVTRYFVKSMKYEGFWEHTG